MHMVRCHLFLPAYNAEQTLPETLERLQTYLSTEQRIHKVTIVDDGSTDNTVVVFEKLIRQTPNAKITLLSLPHNTGKGGALTVAIRTPEKETTHVAFTDIDLPYGTTAIHHLLETASQNTADKLVVIGSRKKGSEVIQYSPYRKVTHHLFRLFIPAEVREIKDTQCGCKLFGIKAAEVLFSRAKTRGWVFDIELLLIAKQHHFPIIEIPVVLQKNAYSLLGGVSLLHHGFAIMRDLVRIRLFHRKKYYSA